MKETYLTFDAEISDETIQNTIGTLQEVEGNIRLYFATDGGMVDYGDILIDYLNSRKDEITIVPFGAVASCGVNILMKFEGNVELTPEKLDYFLIHKADRLQYSTRGDSEVREVLRTQTENLNLGYSHLYEQAGISTDKIKEFNEGKDVYLFQDDLKELNINFNHIPEEPSIESKIDQLYKNTFKNTTVCL